MRESTARRRQQSSLLAAAARLGLRHVPFPSQPSRFGFASFRCGQDGAVLAGVKAEPFGWTSASLVAGCGRLGWQLSERRPGLCDHTTAGGQGSTWVATSSVHDSSTRHSASPAAAPPGRARSAGAGDRGRGRRLSPYRRPQPAPASQQSERSAQLAAAFSCTNPPWTGGFVGDPIGPAAPDKCGADLRAVEIGGADLHDARIGGAGLRDADLHEAKLGGVQLRGVRLNGADLHDANLSGEHFDDWDRPGADLSGADLSGAKLSGAIADNATVWPVGFDWRRAGVTLTWSPSEPNCRRIGTKCRWSEGFLYMSRRRR